MRPNDTVWCSDFHAGLAMAIPRVRFLPRYAAVGVHEADRAPGTFAPSANHW